MDYNSRHYLQYYSCTYSKYECAMRTKSKAIKKTMGGIASQWEGKHFAFEVFCVLSISHQRIISTNFYNKVSLYRLWSFLVQREKSKRTLVWTMRVLWLPMHKLEKVKRSKHFFFLLLTCLFVTRICPFFSDSKLW